MPQPEFAGNDRYRVIRRLGVGGMGVVYEAEDRERRQRVALKSITRADSDLMYRLKREFRLLADISHPNLVDLYDLHADDSGCFYTMELIRGTDFVRYCLNPSKGPIVQSGASPDADTQLGIDLPQVGGIRTTEEIIGYSGRELACDERRLRSSLRQLAMGLHALHESGKVHRDIKPSNVLVDRTGRVVLLDFGLVTDVGVRRSQQSMVGQIVGTAEFMAPEQAGGDGDITAAADWYGVGAMMYEAMTGQLPFVGDPMDMLYEKIRRAPPPPRAIVPSVPEDLDQLCEELLARDPAKRPVGAEVLRRLGVDVGDAQAPAGTQSRITQWVPFAGRDEELVALGAALGRIEHGRAAVVSISGPSGIGKTELVRAFFERVRHQRDDLVVLEGRCYQREAVPYKAMDALIDNLSRVWMQMPEEEARGLVPRYATLLPKLFPVLGRVPAVSTARGRRSAARAQEVRTRAFGALREVFQRLGDRRPLALFIDDMQWVDADTVALLADLMRPPDPPACLLLLCSRDATEEDRRSRRGVDMSSIVGFPTPSTLSMPDEEDEGPLQELLSGFGTLAERIALRPLSSEASVELATRLLGGEAERYSLRVAEESDGNPFVLGELARYVQAVRPGDVATIRLGDVVDHRISRLEETTRRLLELVCIAGEPLSRQVAATAAKLGPDEMTRELRLLGTSQLVRSPGGEGEQVEPYHNRFREAVLAGLSPSDRAAHNEALALALERWNEGSSEQLARHWFASGHADKAADYALRAAEQAVETLDFDRAARHYQMVLAVGTHTEEEQRDLLTRLGDAQANAGRPLDAANAFLAAARTGSQVQRLELRRRAADELLAGGYQQQGMEAMREVLEQIGVTLPRTPRRALASLVWRRFRLRLRGLDFVERDESQIAPEELTRIDTLWSVCYGLSVVDPVVGNEFSARYLLEALRLGEPQRVSLGVSMEAAFASALGARRAPALVQRAQELADRFEGDALARVMALWARGCLEYFATNQWRDSLDRFQRAELELRTTQQAAGWENDNCHLYSCFNLLQLGKLRELSKQVPRFVKEAERRGDRYLDVSMRARLNIIHLAEDDPDTAARSVEDAVRRWAQPKKFQVQHFFALHSACEAALYAGDVDAAWARFERDVPRFEKALLVRIPMVAAEVEYLRARIALRRGDFGQARRAARFLGRSRLPLAWSLRLLVDAALAEVEGKIERAVALHRQAVESLAGIESNLFAHPARRRLGEMIGGDEGAELVRKTDEWFERQGVVAPEAMARMLVPASR